MAVRPKRLLDINTATASQLTLLRGIGRVQAARIIAARPFSGTQELVTRGVISEAAYDRIAPELTVHHRSTVFNHDSVEMPHLPESD